MPVYIARCSLDGRKWWYFSGTTRIDGKVYPVFITSTEHRHGLPFQKVENKSAFLKMRGNEKWKYVDFIKEK